MSAKTAVVFLLFIATLFGAENKAVENASKVIVNISTKYAARTDQNPFSFDPFFGNFYNPKFAGIKLKDLKRKLGSGIVIRSNGYILTAFHVIENTKNLTVTLPGSTEELWAKIVGIDYTNDIAVLKIEKNGLESVFFSENMICTPGMEVVAAGNPYGTGPFVSMGLLSYVAKEGSLEKETAYLQFSGHIHPATSGGALFDKEGNLLGMINAKLTKEAGLKGFAIATPVNVLRKSVLKLLEKEIKEPVWFGISIGSLDKALKDYYKRDRGVVVISVEEDSPAAKAGLRSGDLIISIDDTDIGDVAEMNYKIATMKPGDAKLIEFQRGVEIKEAIVTLVKPFGTVTSETQGVVINGLTLEPLTRKIRRNLAVDKEFKGVVITAVSEGSGAEKAGFMKKDIIIGVDGKEIKTIDNLKSLLLPQKQRFTVFRKGIVKNIIWEKNE